MTELFRPVERNSLGRRDGAGAGRRAYRARLRPRCDIGIPGLFCDSTSATSSAPKPSSDITSAVCWPNSENQGLALAGVFENWAN